MSDPKTEPTEREALEQLLKAADAFWRYVNVFSDPVLDEPSVVALMAARKQARRVLKGTR